jgi:hypothetical protein
MRCSEGGTVNVKTPALRLRSGQALSQKSRQGWGTLEFLFLVIVLVPGVAALAQEKPLLVAYDLKVVVEPERGTISVQGKIGVPVASDAKTLQFGVCMKHSQSNNCYLTIAP